MGVVFLSRAVAYLALTSSLSAASQRMLRAGSRQVEAENARYPFVHKCTALVGFGVDSADPKENNQTWLSCLTPDGMIYDVEAVCKDWVEEKVMRGIIKSNHTTVDVNDAEYDPETDRVTLAKFPPTLIPGYFNPPHLQNRQKGNRTVLAVRVVTLDAEPQVTEFQIKSSLFNQTDGSLTNHMGACSQNKLNFVPKQINALLGGAKPNENPDEHVTTSLGDGYTKADCLVKGEGKETAYASEGDSGNFPSCPVGSFFCYGGGGTYGKEFAMPAELPQKEGQSFILTCYARDDGNKRVDVNVTTHRAKTGFQFGIQGDRYFIAMIQLKAGGGGGESIFQYPFEVGTTKYVGAVPQSGVLFTPTNQKGNYRDISHVKLCVMPRSATCAHLAEAPDDMKNDKYPYGFDGGVITVEVPHYTYEGDSVIRNAVTRQLVDHFGIQNPEEIADYVMYCLPEGVMTKLAYGFVYSWLSVYTDSYCTNLAAQMREFGHNFEFGPSRSWGTTYGDYTGMMGDNHFLHGQRCYNAPKLAQSGWYTDNTVVVRKSTPKNTRIELHGFIKPITPGLEKIPKIVKLERDSKIDIYMMCNWGVGEDIETTGMDRNKVMLAKTGFDGEMFDLSFLVAKLDEGETFTSPAYFDGLCDLTVTVGTIDTAKGICEVTVTGCVEGAPTESPTPAPTAPTVSPTPAPTHTPPPPCYSLNDLCVSEADCCDGGAGAGTGKCLKLAKNENLNVMIVCSPAKADPDMAVGPPGPPGGTCDDNGECGPGENCFSCPRDCNAMLSGDPKDQFCCEDGPPRAPYSIRATDSRCTC